MAIMFHRGLVIRLSAVAFCAVALSAPPRVVPFLIALLGVAVIASMMPMIIRWLRTFRPLGDVRTARTPQADDAVDLVRMDDDGERQMAQPALPHGPAHRPRAG